MLSVGCGLVHFAMVPGFCLSVQRRVIWCRLAYPHVCSPSLEIDLDLQCQELMCAVMGAHVWGAGILVGHVWALAYCVSLGFGRL